MKGLAIGEAPNVSNARYLIPCFVLVIFLARAATAAAILIGDDKSRPESLTIAPHFPTHIFKGNDCRTRCLRFRVSRLRPRNRKRVR